MAKGKDRLRASVVVTIEIDEAEWMDRFGDHIRANVLVPNATLASFAKKAVSEKVESLGFRTCEVK